MRRHLIAPLIAGLLLLASVSATLAVGFHQHYLTTPSGQVVPIAQGVCQNQLQEPIDNLHEHVHFGAPADAFASNPVSLAASACP